MSLRTRYHLIGYVIVSIIMGLLITAVFAQWTMVPGGSIWDHYWDFIIPGMVLGFFAGIFVYCFAAGEAGFW
ncbi:MAG: hypothetical protein EAX95_00935 [Candidatus Thorarchaeota archaeon]|nr:hypothetical protein [Candidatus Thorarchaeota archaeon]